MWDSWGHTAKWQWAFSHSNVSFCQWGAQVLCRETDHHCLSSVASMNAARALGLSTWSATLSKLSRAMSINTPFPPDTLAAWPASSGRDFQRHLAPLTCTALPGSLLFLWKSQPIIHTTLVTSAKRLHHTVIRPIQSFHGTEYPSRHYHI